MPVFNLICSYILWKRHGEKLNAIPELGREAMDLIPQLARHRVVRCLVERADRENLTGQDKNAIAGCLAQRLGINYADLISRGNLHS